MSKKLKKPKNFISVSWDHKALADEVFSDTVDAINQLLKRNPNKTTKPQLYYYDDLLYYGSDMYGRIISTEPLTEQDLSDYQDEIMKEIGGEEDNGDKF